MRGRLGIVLVAALALIACREDEQGRVRSFSPGVYQGGAMPEIDDADRTALAERVARQDY